MKHTISHAQATTANCSRPGWAAVGLALLLASTISGTSCATTAAAPDPTVDLAPAAAQAEASPAAELEVIAATVAEVDAPAAEPEPQSAKIADRWGIEVTSVRLTASDHMIDYRYRVLDAEKAGDLFKRQIQPRLIHQESGKVLTVPNTAKLGPLRNSDTPQTGKIYWMFFGNAGYLVKPGDKVTVVIGEFRVENLVVE